MESATENNGKNCIIEALHARDMAKPLQIMNAHFSPCFEISFGALKSSVLNQPLSDETLLAV